MTKLTDRRIAYACRQADKGGEGETPKQMAARWGCTDRRIRQLVQIYRETGKIPTLNPNRRPKAPPLTPDERKAIERAREDTKRGATKIYRALRKAGIQIPKHKIHAYAVKKGWSTPNPRKQKKRSRCRYEREHTGSLLHGDWHRTTIDHPHVILWEDDASRYVLGGGEYPEESAEHSIHTLQEALKHAREWNLTIHQVNTDRGSVFYANKSSDHKKPGTSQFEHFLQEEGIQFIPSRRNNPQTNGKLERLWYEYDRHRHRFNTLQDWIDWYNRQIHDALWLEIYETPEEAFQRKLPPEALLGLHHSIPTPTQERATS